MTAHEHLPLTPVDAKLLSAYMQSDADFFKLGEELGHARETLIQWLCAPPILAAVTQLKAIELERCHAVAAKVRTSCMHSLSTLLDSTTKALASEVRSPNGTPSSLTQLYMRVASLLSRLSTFKPTQLKELPPITSSDPAHKKTAHSNAASSTSNYSHASTKHPQQTPPTSPTPVRVYRD